MNTITIQNKKRRRNIFIDCGGYDGCSVVKFMLERPDYECYSFEPNPELHHYFRFLPTTLIPAAVHSSSGTQSLTLDPIDANGSSLLKEKQIDSRGRIKNSECPTIQVQSIVLSEWILSNLDPKDYICLKLDIEGSEYDVIADLLNSGAIRFIDEIYVEFHYDKANIPVERHNFILEKLNEALTPIPWDAHYYGIHKRAMTRTVLRIALCALIYCKKITRKIRPSHPAGNR
jgi:FkbM family methyltransferase